MIIIIVIEVEITFWLYFPGRVWLCLVITFLVSYVLTITYLYEKIIIKYPIFHPKSHDEIFISSTTFYFSPS